VQRVFEPSLVRLRLAVWPNGNDVKFYHVIEVSLRRTWLVLKWVTVRGCTSGLTFRGITSQLTLLPLAGQETSTGQMAVAVFGGWEGNRRSGVALALRHRLFDVSTYRLMA